MGFRKQAGLNAFVLPHQRRIEVTGARGIISKARKGMSATTPQLMKMNNKQLDILLLMVILDKYGGKRCKVW
jgi:hypothetical protein